MQEKGLRSREGSVESEGELRVQRRAWSARAGPGQGSTGKGLGAESSLRLAEGPGDVGAWTRGGAGRGGGQSGLGTTGSQGGAGRGPRGGSEVGPRAAPHPLLLLLLRRPRCGCHHLPQPSPALLRHGRRASRLPSRARLTTAFTAFHWPRSPPLFSRSEACAAPIGRAPLCPSPPAPWSAPLKSSASPSLPLRAANCTQWLPPLSFRRCHGDVSPPTAQS